MKKLFTSLILMLVLLMPVSLVSAKSAAPSKVTVKSLKASGINSITLTWNKAKNATAYQVSYKEGSGKWKVLATLKSNKTSYTHKASFTGGRKYTYQVKAYNKKSKKTGAYNTNGISVTAPKPAVTPAKPSVTPKPTPSNPEPEPEPEPTPAPAPKPTPSTVKVTELF